MIYLVFEAGSRAGLSARLCFQRYKKLNPHTEHKLVMVDDDDVFENIALSCDPVTEMKRDMLPLVMTGCSVMPFPADELTRQSESLVDLNVVKDSIWEVSPQYYDKSFVNYVMYRDSDIKVRIPFTFDFNNVCVKPNTMSAGSKGIQLLDNVCVSEKIDIKNEYVIDVLRNDKGQATYWGRQVKMRAGYDKYIKFLSYEHPAIEAAKFIVERASIPESQPIHGLFSRIFHIQLAEDDNGTFWFIEASKRISGTSLVNIPFGFDPFEFIETQRSIWIKPADIDFEKWYLYDDLLIMTSQMI